MTRFKAQDFFTSDDLPSDAVLEGAELESAFWQLKKMQRESQQQQAFWRSVNESMSDAYAKLAAFQEQLRASREELKQANDGLEEKVRERTQELRSQVEHILRQEATIRALFTPIIRVWDRVLVLPIVGALDQQRVAEITRNLLQVVVESRSAFVVLDLTGVQEVDSETADHLIRIHRAVRLLGAACLISGISAALSRSFVALDINVGDLVSFGTLHAALHHALLQMGELPGGPRGHLTRVMRDDDPPPRRR